MITEDQQLVEKMNAASIGDRLLFIHTMIERSVKEWSQAEPFHVTIVEHPEVFEAALKLLKNLSENEGKVEWNTLVNSFCRRGGPDRFGNVFGI